jgi:AAA domain
VTTSDFLVLIQGPPGTGKTYVGVEIVKALLHNKAALDLKPIICVYAHDCLHLLNGSCYTNHALDQFLEHLLPITKRIVRMGSMSKSEKLDKYNLFEMVNGQDETKTRAEKKMEYQSNQTLNLLREEGDEMCDLLFKGAYKLKWKQLSALLKKDYRNHYDQILGEADPDGFVKVGKQRGNFFNYWKFASDLKDREIYESLYGKRHDHSHVAASRPLNDLVSSSADIWDFSRDERTQILCHWESQLRQGWIDDLVILAQEYQAELDELEKVRSECNRRLLEKVDIIGLTTTGLARYASLLDHVNAKTLICEEAGEVLEVLFPYGR